MKINKQTLMAMVAAAGVLHLQPQPRAAEAKEAAPPAGEGRLAAARERMQETAKELNLTEEQKQKLQSIVRERMEKLRDLRQDNNLTREEKMEKFKAAREDITAEVKKVLTPEQFEKWKAKQGPVAESLGQPAARLQDSIQALNLTDEQKEQLKPLYQEQMEKLRELRQNSSLSMAEKFERLKAVRQEIGPKLKKVLDAEQYAKWEKEFNRWVDELKARFQGQKEK